MAEETCKLARYWRRLQLPQRLHLLEGLPEADRVAIAEEGGGLGSEEDRCEQFVRDLVLAPAVFCFKVRVVFTFTGAYLVTSFALSSGVSFCSLRW